MLHEDGEQQHDDAEREASKIWGLKTPERQGQENVAFFLFRAQKSVDFLYQEQPVKVAARQDDVQ